MNNPPNNGNGQKSNRPRDIGFYVVILVILLSGVFIMVNQSQNENRISYAEIRQQFLDENVTFFRVKDGVLTLSLKSNFEGAEIITHRLYSEGIFYEDLHELYEAQKDSGIISDYDFEPSWETPWWVTFVPYLVILAAFLGFWYYMMNREMGGGKNGANSPFKFGRARTRDATKDKKKITFADVASAEEEKEELKEIVDFLKEPKRFTEMGARIPKGILLVGPPGTGKTYLAKAVAGEAGVQFLSISGSDFVELYVGIGASRVRDLFDQAKKTAPSIIFIDEIDAVGRQRGAGLGGGHDEREQTLNQLLVEMDGFGTNEGVIVMAATNRQDILDKALLRPGRFDRTVYVGLPDIKGREEILKIHSKDKRLAEDVGLRKIAQITAGFTPADLENLMNESALLAARSGHKFIIMRDVEESMIKVIAGPAKRSKVLTDKERHDTAVHEAGHAIPMQFLEHTDNVHQITIIPRGRSLGMTINLPEQDKNSIFKNEMLDRIVMSLGGRTAERLILKDITTGASQDLQMATSIARDMVMRYGMSDLLGPISFSNDSNEVFIGRDFAQSKPYSETVAAIIDKEIKRIIDESDKRCERILMEHTDILDITVEYLLEYEVMDGATFKFLCEHGYLPSKSDLSNGSGGSGIDITITDDYHSGGDMTGRQASPA